MTDIIDRAQQIETFKRELEIRAARSGATALASPAAFGLCEDCADPIDAERRKACPGARKCLFCQEAAERFLRFQSR